MDRDELAKAAITGKARGLTATRKAIRAYKIADAMLAEREKNRMSKDNDADSAKQLDEIARLAAINVRGCAATHQQWSAGVATVLEKLAVEISLLRPTESERKAIDRAIFVLDNAGLEQSAGVLREFLERTT